MDDDNDLLRYTVKDNLCAKAIEEFKKTTSVSEWLQENRSLYHSVSYQPPGLPRIMAFNLRGTRFENIQNFGELYGRLDTLDKGDEKT
jgi:hypothetical protein